MSLNILISLNSSQIKQSFWYWIWTGSYSGYSLQRTRYNKTMAGLKKRPLVAPKLVKSAPITKRTAKIRRSPSPNPILAPPPTTNSNKSLGSSPVKDSTTSLPPPSSITPMSTKRRSLLASKSNNNHNLPSSPLNNKFEQALQTSLNSMNKAKSSPLKPTATRLNSLPSPSPEFTRQRHIKPSDISKSSPIRSKKVMFTENLVMNDRTIPTPKKSILKSTFLDPPQMNPLVPTNSQSSNSNQTLISSSNASRLEFWTPGNIPRLSSSSSNTVTTNEELVFFKNILHGGIIVLDIPSCERQFEIYATLNLLLKDLNDKKILILLGSLSELTRLLKRDLVSIENEILNNESNAFLVRTDIQITKILTQLLSNNKIMLNFWKKSKINFDLGKWCINHSSSLILKQTISKSLITANLQLLKDHKLHSYLNTSIQEFILYALLNMKHFNSSSLLVERLYTLKSLIINHTLMMEKNSKSWLPFLFNCLCDFNSPIYQKQQQVAVQCLLEASKLYLTSKNVNFEIHRSLTLPIHKTLNIQPESQISINSTPLDLQQTTFTYIIGRSLELLQDQSKIAMDLWLGITLMFYSTNESLTELPIEIDSPWFLILKKALTSESDEIISNGIRAYKGLFYVLYKNGKFPENLELMFNGFKLIKRDFIDHESLSIFVLQIIYSFFNNTFLIKQFFSQIWPYIDTLLNDLSGRNEILQKFPVKVFTHVIYQQQRQQDPFYLVKCLGNDKFNINEIQPLQPDTILKNHELIWKTFINSIWNSNETVKVKVQALFTLMGSIKNVSVRDNDITMLNKLFGALELYKDFIPEYLKAIDQFSDSDKSLYIEKFLLNIKNTFGNRAFLKESNGILVFNQSNVYVTMALNHYNSPKNMFNESIKIIVNVIKAHQYKFYESLIMNHKDKLIVQYLNNYLGSKIFEKLLPSFEIQSIGNTISNLDKDENLWKNYLSYITKCSTITPLQGISYLKISSWSATEIIKFTKHIHTHHQQLTTPFTQCMVTELQSMSSIIAIDFFNKLLIHDQMWILNQLKEHIYFHVMDPDQQYSDDVHFYGLAFFDKYLQKIQKNGNEQIDGFLAQGLELCEALKKNQKVLTTTPQILKLIQGVIKNALKESIILENLPKVKKFVDDQIIQQRQNLSSLVTQSPTKESVKEVSSSDLSANTSEAKDIPNVTDQVDYDLSVDSTDSKGAKDDIRDEEASEIPTQSIAEVNETEDEVEIEKTQADKPNKPKEDLHGIQSSDVSNNDQTPELTPPVEENVNDIADEAVITEDSTVQDTVEIQQSVSLNDNTVDFENKSVEQDSGVEADNSKVEEHDTVEIEDKAEPTIAEPAIEEPVEKDQEVTQEAQSETKPQESLENSVQSDTVEVGNEADSMDIDQQADSFTDGATSETESQSRLNFKIGEFRKRVEIFKEKKRLSKIVEEFNKSGIRPSNESSNTVNPELTNSSESIDDSDPKNRNIDNNGDLIAESTDENVKDLEAKDTREAGSDYNDTLIIPDDEQDSLKNSNEVPEDKNVTAKEVINEEPKVSLQESEVSQDSKNDKDENIEQPIQVIDQDPQRIEKSASVELTNEWADHPSDEPEFYDAQTNVNPSSSPVHESTSSDAGERFFESQEDISSPKKSKTEEPIDQVVETQEIPDSNEALVVHKPNEEESQPSNDVEATQETTEDTDVGTIGQDKDDEKENDIPSDSMVLYSSPLKHIRSKNAPLSNIDNHNQDIQNTPTRSSRKRQYQGGEEEQPTGANHNYESSDEDSDGDIVEIDDSEFSKSFISSSPRKPISNKIEPAQKKQRLEHINSPGLDVLTPPDENPVVQPIDKINDVFNSFTDHDISNLNDKEVYEIENKMLAFMMRLRNRK
ncbi:hypothetical protein BN7_689 [Wickerhamomyces ciferrii]|uniref:Uncharacterized protein n=1 Tax=Wickerhamomyces ciferrii (strain ATCC 14091 / BCRC 22168 / CBS 111 / JCM 3599 / NBRC 0793 / NRRL Y-1031 F-60-10) TaxID=1206466 RepID=K0KG21_WICCF|nr:uncharacterized protein BN7_689 [Wickerhamomyces ciferrii]CCH41152.1 hypothetical protein BN7_689 [Wickerhamomyces ciferrii]